MSSSVVLILPGGNVFTEFFTTIKKSSYTIVIVTKGFVEDCWGMYKFQAAFIKHIQNSNSNRFIAVYVDIDDHHIPPLVGFLCECCNSVLIVERRSCLPAWC
jgi:hypothetical protein